MTDLPRFGGEASDDTALAGEDNTPQTLVNTIMADEETKPMVVIPDRHDILPRPKPPTPRPRVTYKSGIEWRYFVPISTVFGLMGLLVMIYTA